MQLILLYSKITCQNQNNKYQLLHPQPIIWNVKTKLNVSCPPYLNTLRVMLPITLRTL